MIALKEMCRQWSSGSEPHFFIPKGQCQRGRNRTGQGRDGAAQPAAQERRHLRMGTGRDVPLLLLAAADRKVAASWEPWEGRSWGAASSSILGGSASLDARAVGSGSVMMGCRASYSIARFRQFSKGALTSGELSSGRPTSCNSRR